MVETGCSGYGVLCRCWFSSEFFFLYAELCLDGSGCQVGDVQFFMVIGLVMVFFDRVGFG